MLRFAAYLQIWKMTTQLKRCILSAFEQAMSQQHLCKRWHAFKFRQQQLLTGMLPERNLLKHTLLMALDLLDVHCWVIYDKHCKAWLAKQESFAVDI